MKVQEIGETFSISKLLTFRKCPQKAYLRYIEGKKENPVFFILGRGVHFGQEQDNLAKLRGVHLSVDQVLDAAVDGVVEETKKIGVLAGKMISKDSFVTEHREQLEKYEKSGARAKVVPVRDSVEAEFRLTVDREDLGGPAKLVGYVDVVSAGVGCNLLVDYKKVKRPATVREVDDNFQFALYQVGAGTRGGSVVNFIGGPRQRPSVRIVPIHESTPEQRNRLFKFVGDAIRDFRHALKTGDFPKCSPDCYWCRPAVCDYYGLCYPDQAKPSDLVQVVKLETVGTLPQAEWRKIHGSEDSNGGGVGAQGAQGHDSGVPGGYQECAGGAPEVAGQVGEGAGEEAGEGAE